MQSPRIRIAIADDHALYRDGLTMLLEKEPDFEIVASAHNGKELVEKVFNYSPDVAIVDLSMPEMGGVHAIKEITGKSNTRCMAHSSIDTHYTMMDAISAGATGFVGKNALRGEIAEGIRMIAAGEPFYCKATAATLAKAISKKRFHPASKPIGFSEKEIRILYLIAQEKSNKEISELMFLSYRTVEGIRSALLSKMNVKTSTGMIVYALKHHLFTLDDLGGQ